MVSILRNVNISCQTQRAVLTDPGLVSLSSSSSPSNFFMINSRSVIHHRDIFPDTKEGESSYSRDNSLLILKRSVDHADSVVLDNNTLTHIAVDRLRIQNPVLKSDCVNRLYADPSHTWTLLEVVHDVHTSLFPLWRYRGYRLLSIAMWRIPIAKEGLLVP